MSTCLSVCVYMYIYIYIYTYIHTYIHTYTPYNIIYCLGPRATRGKQWHAGNRHLRNHLRFPVACSNLFSVAFSNGISLASGISQRIVAGPVICLLELFNGLSVAFSDGFSFV